MTIATINPVILCGGSGTRLWPLSRSGFPKQFLVLSGDDSSESLFQQAIERINVIATPQIQMGSTLIVTNEDHRFLALDQLRELHDIQATLLLEPAGRNTAPALALAAFQAKDLGGNDDPILVITPADQTVQDGAAFTRALQNCVEVVSADIKKKPLLFWVLLQAFRKQVMATLSGLVAKALMVSTPLKSLLKSLTPKQHKLM